MDNSVKKLVDLLEPLILNLDSEKKVLDDKKQELENVSRLLAYTKDNLDMVGIYADQDLIINNLYRIDSNKDEYRASCYLLNSENQNIKQLPQYEEAYNLISDIIECFKLYKAELIVETQELEKVYHEKEIDKKYYNIFSNNSLFVDDIQEFTNFLDKHNLTNEDKINILIYTIKNNYNKYTKKNS